MSAGTSTGNTAPGVTVAAALLFSWALLFYVVRCWVKARQRDSWGLDDTTISLSFVFAFAHMVVVSTAVHHGYDNAWADLSVDDRPAVEKALYAGQILYVLSVGLTRISTSFFTGHFLTRDQRQVWLATGLTSACGFWTIACAVIIALRRPLLEPWTTINGNDILYYRWLFVEASGLAIDLVGLSLAIYFIWGLQMAMKKRAIVCGIFACRLAVVPFVALRIWALAPADHDDSAAPDAKASIYTELVMNLAFMLASITCLKPFLQPFHAGYFVSTARSGVTGYNSAIKGSKGSKDQYYELSKTRSTKGGEIQRHAATVTTGSGAEVGRISRDRIRPSADVLDDELNLIEPHAKASIRIRPDHVDYRAAAHSAGGPHRKQGARGIEKTQHVSG